MEGKRAHRSDYFILIFGAGFAESGQVVAGVVDAVWVAAIRHPVSLNSRIVVTHNLDICAIPGDTC